MIRKIILALCMSASLVCGAQVMEKYPGFRFSKMSNNGRYLLSGSAGVTIYDREIKQTYRYGSEYSLGKGNAVSDNGIVVAAALSAIRACYWKDGEWHDLGHSVGSKASVAMANGVTPDGSRIVGSIDCRPVTGKSWPMVSPVIWIWDDAAGDYVFEMLPEPATDITGCVPQQVSATCVSSDGRTVLGQVTDQRGFLEYQIIYRQSDDGSWTYEISGANRLQKEDAEWPPYPSRPVKPQASDYLTDDEKLEFNKANQAYKDSLEIVSLTGKNPRMPFYEEFVKERKEEYDAAMKQFDEDNDSYLTRLYAFFDAYAANVTNNRFEFNSHLLSDNGEYYVCNYYYPNPDSEDGDLKMYVSPILYELKNLEVPRLTEDVSMGVFSICDDGTMMVATPRDDEKVYSRTPYMIRLDAEPVAFTDWLQENYTEAYRWLMDNMSYRIPEEGAGALSVLAGTVRMSPDAAKLISYIFDPETDQYVSYFMDLKGGTGGIGCNVGDGVLQVFHNTATGILNLVGDPDRVDIFDMSGRRIYGEENPPAVLPVSLLGGPGVYVVRLVDKYETVTEKIMVK